MHKLAARARAAAPSLETYDFKAVGKSAACGLSSQAALAADLIPTLKFTESKKAALAADLFSRTSLEG